MLRARRTAAVRAGVLALALLFGGCSKGGKSFVPVATTTTLRSATSAQGPTTTSTPVSANAFCNFLATYQDRFGKVTPALAEPALLRTTMEEAAKAIKDAQGQAPDAIKADVGLLSDAFQILLTGFEQANFNIARLSPATLQRMAAPEFVAASGRLDNYIRQNCP